MVHVYAMLKSLNTTRNPETKLNIILIAILIVIYPISSDEKMSIFLFKLTNDMKAVLFEFMWLGSYLIIPIVRSNKIMC